MNYTLFGPHFGGSPSTSFQLFDSSDSCPSLCCDELPLDRLFSSDICPRFRLVATGLPADDRCFPAISSMSRDWLGGRFSFPCGCGNPVKYPSSQTYCQWSFSVVANCWRWLQSPNDVIQKNEKTLNNTQHHKTKQKGTNNSLCNAKKHPLLTFSGRLSLENHMKLPSVLRNVLKCKVFDCCCSLLCYAMLNDFLLYIFQTTPTHLTRLQ